MVASRFRPILFAGFVLIALLSFGCATYPYQEDPNIDDNGRFGAWDGGANAYYYDASTSLFEETGGTDYWYPGSDDNYYERTIGYDPQGYWRH